MRRMGMFPESKPKKKYQPKPYEQMTHPGERIQIDVKVVPKRCIANPELRLFQYTAIDEFSRLRFLAAYPEQSTYSSADFLKRAVEWFARRGVRVECVQTDNGFEFTNRFSPSKKHLLTLFEATAAKLHIRHKLIRPYTPRHNGKVERSHREDQKRFYDKHHFYSKEHLFLMQLRCSVFRVLSAHFCIRDIGLYGCKTAQFNLLLIVCPVKYFNILYSIQNKKRNEDFYALQR
jgi:transposase InsO family protein